MNDFVGADQSLDATALDLLRRVGIERQDLGQRLARHEFQALRQELTSPDPFALRVELGGPAHTPDSNDPAETVPEFYADESAFGVLPVLPVPLGRIAWFGRPQDLPVTGIAIPLLDGQDLADQLLSLLTEHHRTAFSRLVFLCRDLSPVHLLGRYGFIVHDIGHAELDDIGALMFRRYGMRQIRGLDGGRKLWEEQQL